MSEILCHGMGKECVVTDLCVKAADIQLPNIQEDDLAIIGNDSEMMRPFGAPVEVLHGCRQLVP